MSLSKNVSLQLDLQVGQCINCNKLVKSLWYEHTKGYIEDIVDGFIFLSNSVTRDEMAVIDINDYPDIYIMDGLESAIFKQLGV